MYKDLPWRHLKREYEKAVEDERAVEKAAEG